MVCSWCYSRDHSHQPVCVPKSLHLAGSVPSSLVPSISSKCVDAYNSTFRSGNVNAICIAECQSLYMLYAQCAGTTHADIRATTYCGQVEDGVMVSAVQSACSNATYCSPSCVTAIAALQLNSGCCRYSELNGPKVLCGQQPVAPCSTILNSGSVAAPSSKCAYLVYTTIISKWPRSLHR